MARQQPQSDLLPSARAYNITNGEPQTLHSIVQKLIDELGIKCRIRSVPYPMLDIIARSMERFGNKSAKEPAFTHYGVSKLNFDFTLDISRAQQELGYQPVITMDEGILRTAAWLKDHGKPALLTAPVLFQQRFGYRQGLRIGNPVPARGTEVHLESHNDPLLLRWRHFRRHLIAVARQDVQQRCGVYRLV